MVKIKEKYEDAKQENEKMTRELIKRKLRYTKNEQGYRAELDLLHREMRCRLGREENIADTNMTTVNRHNEDIKSHIDELESKVEILIA